MGAAVVRGRLLAVGGFNGKTFLNTLETLNCAPAHDDGDGEPEWTAFVDRQTWLLDSNTSADQASRPRSEGVDPQETPDESSRGGVALTRLGATNANLVAREHTAGVNEQDANCDNDEVDEVDEDADEVEDVAVNASSRGSRESSSGISGC